MSNCVTCLSGPDCLPSDDINLMSLDRSVFPFVLDCPEVSCFTPDTDITMACCQNTITRHIPLDATVEEWNQIIGQMLTQCNAQSAFCAGGGNDPNIPVIIYANHQKSCTRTCPDGSPFTFLVPAGVFIALDQSVADQMAAAAACQFATSEVICLGSLPRCTCADVAYSARIPIISGATTARWSVTSGSLPDGLTLAEGLNSNGGTTISGTPTVPGTFTFSVTASTQIGGHMTKSFTIVVIKITTTSLPPFTVGVPFNYQLQADGGSGDYSWKVASGTLPAGLTLSISGLISGTPT